ncbi:MAG: tail fiber domain-containing protein [Verrucomicrobiales bacterium]
MNKSAIIAATLGLTLGSLRAQTVPLIINYQGKVTGSSGVPLGSTGSEPNFTAAPENRKVIFRIFDAQTGGNRLWSEQQTVTITLGEFSVLLGQGIDAVYDSTTEPRPALDTVFAGGGAVPPAGPIRYLEIVVDNGDGTFLPGVDDPITPRQRITTTAYSFRSKVADTVADLSIATPALADGAVTAAKVADNSITSLKILDGSISTTKIPDSAITSFKIADGTVATADLANAAITSAKLDPSIGVWTANGADVFRSGGRVGIGKQPEAALDVAGAIAATGNITAAGALTGSSISTTGPFAATTITANAGMNIAGNSVLELGVGIAGKEANAGKIAYQTFSPALDIIGAGTTAPNRRIKMWAEGGTEFNGRVGIGTSSPEVPLDVVGSTIITMTEQPYDGFNGAFDGSGTIWTPSGVTDLTRAWGISVYSTWGQNRPDLGGNSLVRVTTPIGIRSDAWIASRMGFEAYSDSRIKRDLHASETEQDLAVIQKLQVTDYRMIDPADGGMDWRKGFIAQAVEKVIPGAVKRSTEFVPEIFSTATALEWHAGANTLSLTLAKDHELIVGDRVRLHVDGGRLDLNVREVPSAREFVVENCDRKPEKVLVYGKQVKDFRTVDYDRIFTTAVGALQELKKEKDEEVNALQEENAALKKELAEQGHRLAALEAKEKEREARFAAFEKLLESAGSGGSTSRTVSLETAAASK